MTKVYTANDFEDYLNTGENLDRAKGYIYGWSRMQLDQAKRHVEAMNKFLANSFMIKMQADYKNISVETLKQRVQTMRDYQQKVIKDKENG